MYNSRVEKYRFCSYLICIHFAKKINIFNRQLSNKMPKFFIFLFMVFLFVSAFSQHAGGVCSTCISFEKKLSKKGESAGKKCIQIPYNQQDSICGTPDNALEKKGYTLVFQDEFENGLDTVRLKTAQTVFTEILPKGKEHTYKMTNEKSRQGIYPKWRVIEGEMVGNNPDMRADAENVVCKNGKLSLKMTENTSPFSRYSGATVHAAAFVRFGYFEAKIKIPKGKSFWPALWLYSSYPENCIYQEIDIMEFMQNGTIDGDVFAGSLGHNGNKGTTWRYSSGKIMKKSPECNELNSSGFYIYPYIEGCNAGLKRMLDLSKDYFIYAAEWSKDSVIYYLNNTRLYAFANDSNMTKLPMGLIIGCGMMKGSGHTNILCKDNLPNEYTLFPNELSVEYVRIYKKEEDFQDALSLFPETENTDNQTIRKIAMREFYPNNEYQLQLFSEAGEEVLGLESGYEEGKYDTLLLYKLPQFLSKGVYRWRLTIVLFDGKRKIVEKKVIINN